MSATPAAPKHDKIWSWGDFVYAHLLDALLDSAEQRYNSPTQGRLKDAYNYHRETDPPAKRTDADFRNLLSQNRHQFGKALDHAIGFLRTMGKLTKRNDVHSFWEREELKTSAFESYEEKINERLSLLLPEIQAMDDQSWPGALPVQQALALFTQLSLRIHSEVPEVERNEVLKVALRMVVKPALAFGIYQAGYASEPQPFARRLIAAIATGSKEMPKPKQFWIESKDSREKKTPKRRDEARRCIEDHAWERLILGLQQFSDVILGKEFTRSFAAETLKMLDEHVSHPHGSDMWNALSRLSSTTPGANELLVFDALDRLGKHYDAGPMRARLFCSRTRYQAIEEGYRDTEFRDLLTSTPDIIEREVTRSLEAGKWSPRERLAKAFLLSRRCLIPSDSAPGQQLPAQEALSGLVIRLLEENCSANLDPQERLVSLRYLAGFLTNPRFARSINTDRNGLRATECITRYEAALRGEHDKFLVHLFQGRMQWVSCLREGADTEDAKQRIYTLYGKASEALFDPSRTASILDSEAPVWLMPEIVTLISLDEDLAVPDEYRKDAKTFAKDNSRSISDLARSIQRIGERHFGIYFNQPTESRRIRLGILRSAGLTNAESDTP